MKGILWKWTNYWNGWQTRWFILEEGILSYYLSLEEVNLGCKGSLKVSACKIVISNVDHTRMDLIIPGEKCIKIYLKASSSQERQQWLIALGSAKAQLCSKHNCDQEDIPPDELKSKKSELKLYCDLLMQQIHDIKFSSTSNNGQPDVENLLENSKTLQVTCDTFINTLDDIMKLYNNSEFLPPTIQEVNNNQFQTKRTLMERKSSKES